MNRTLVVLLTTTALTSGCANQALLEQQRAAQERQRQAILEIQNVIDNCNTKIRNEPGLDATLGSKIALYDIRNTTLATMASTEKPTEEEKK